MWRLAVVLFACALAGCAGEVPSTADSTTGASAAAPFHAAERLWLPEQSGPDPATAAVGFDVNASGFEIVASVTIAASLSVADAPATVSSVSMSLLAPDGTELARASHAPGPATSHELRARAPVAGVFQLVFECERTGGGAGTGDYADFDIRAGAPPA